MKYEVISRALINGEWLEYKMVRNLTRGQARRLVRRLGRAAVIRHKAHIVMKNSIGVWIGEEKKDKIFSVHFMRKDRNS